MGPNQIQCFEPDSYVEAAVELLLVLDLGQFNTLSKFLVNDGCVLLQG